MIENKKIYKVIDEEPDALPRSIMDVLPGVLSLAEVDYSKSTLDRGRPLPNWRTMYCAKQCFKDNYLSLEK